MISDLLNLNMDQKESQQKMWREKKKLLYFYFLSMNNV